MPADILRSIRLLQILHLLLRQRLSPNLQGLINPLDLANSNNRNIPLLNRPRHRHMTHLPALLLRQLLHPSNDGLIRIGEIVLLDALGPRRGAAPRKRPRERSLVQRRPGDQTDPGLGAVAVHLALFLAVEEAVVVLHRDELGPVVLFRAGLHHGELVGPHAAGPDVADLAHLDQVVERFHGFFNGGASVEAVDLEEVHVVGLQPG
jgi:hypothetical protein